MKDEDKEFEKRFFKLFQIKKLFSEKKFELNTKSNKKDFKLFFPIFVDNKIGLDKKKINYKI